MYGLRWVLMGFMCLDPKFGVCLLKFVIKPYFSTILWILRWSFMGFMCFMHTICWKGKHLGLVATILHPNLCAWVQKLESGDLKLSFVLILWVFKWVFIGSMGSMHTNCGSVRDLTHMLSSYIQIHEPGPKLGVWLLKIAIKPNFWPNFMGFKVVFHGFYGFYAYKLWFR